MKRFAAPDCRSDLRSVCSCESIERPKLVDAVDRLAGEEGFFGRHLADKPHLFAGFSVRVPRTDFEAMTDLVSVVEALSRLPAYREAVSQWAPSALDSQSHGEGLFMGYDFHLTDEGPRLIEINTNAGGAFLCAAAAEAACHCWNDQEPAERFEEGVTQAFRREWWLAGRPGSLESVAIVDDAPSTQFLHPEFELAKARLERHGIAVEVADPSRLSAAGDRLVGGKGAVDLVYNRSTDFGLSDPGHASLRWAYDEATALVSPSPRHHALLAHKRNLTLLSDPDRMRGLGASDADLSALRLIPRTVAVTASDAESLWTARKSLFFKPVASHASKGVYRGAKLTRSVFRDIVDADYVAQSFVPAPERSVELDGETVRRKVDVRLYTHAGTVLLAAARIYQGQATNMLTEGGGFAPVFVG